MTPATPPFTTTTAATGDAAVSSTGTKSKKKKKQKPEMKKERVWNIRQLNAKTSAEIVTVESCFWTGAVTVYQCRSKKFLNFYCGNGLKYVPSFYTPTLPLPVQANYDEWRTFEEPIPKDAPAGDAAADDAEDAEEPAAEDAETAEEDGDDDDANEETTITHIRSVFVVQPEVLLPPEVPEAEADADAAGEGAEEEEEVEEDQSFQKNIPLVSFCSFSCFV